MIEVEGRWRRKLGKKKEKYILLCRYIILISRIGKLKLECCIVKWYCVIDKVVF